MKPATSNEGTIQGRDLSDGTRDATGIERTLKKRTIESISMITQSKNTSRS